MTDWTHRTVITEAAITPNARALCAMVPGGAGMFTTALSPTGQAPATHYVSAGLIWPQFAAMLGSPEGMVAGAAEMGMPIDLPTATYLLSHADVSEEDGHTAIARLGLQMVQEES